MMNKQYDPLSNDQMELLMMSVLAEGSEKMKDGKKVEIPDEDIPFLGQIIKKRIDVLKLPIKFTNLALVTVDAFAKNPGAAVIVLIDALDKMEGQEINVQKLCELYPMGFYTYDVFEKKVDEYKEDCRRKPEDRKFKWSCLYGGA